MCNSVGKNRRRGPKTQKIVKKSSKNRKNPRCTALYGKKTPKNRQKTPKNHKKTAKNAKITATNLGTPKMAQNPQNPLKCPKMP